VVVATGFQLVCHAKFSASSPLLSGKYLKFDSCNRLQLLRLNKFLHGPALSRADAELIHPDMRAPLTHSVYVQDSNGFIIDQ